MTTLVDAVTTSPSADTASGVRLTVDYWTVAMEGQSSCGACDATLTALEDAAATVRPLARQLGVMIDIVPRTVTTWEEALEHAITASPTIRAQGIELRPDHTDDSETRRWHWRGAVTSEAPAEALLDLLLRAVATRSTQLSGYLVDGGPAPYVRRFLDDAPPATVDQPTSESCGCGVG